ncbi:MAG: hypothetical protein ACR2JD_04890 [Nocardioides sp.]
MRRRPDHHETAFRAWCAAREPELQRTAHLLTGDLAAVRVHVREVLAVALAACATGEADLDPLARRALVAAVVSGSAAGVTDETGVAFTRAEGTATDPRQLVVWDFLSTLGRARRAAVVLRLNGRYDDETAAEMLGVAAPAVATDADAAIDDLAALLALPPTEAESLAVATLDARAETTPVAHTPYAAVRDVARRRRLRRTRAGALLGAAALVAVVVPVSAFSGGGLPTAPDPASPESANPEPSPGGFDGFEPDDRVPPPWVLAPGAQSLTFTLKTKCTSPRDEDFRSITMIPAGCRTLVKRR